jgi:hypothetical protein
LDWNLAITRNREALNRIVAALFAMIHAAAGLNTGKAEKFTLPRHIYSAILAVLRPAESALRRLIFIAASIRAGKNVRNASTKSEPNPQFWQNLSNLSSNSPGFQLLDPLKPVGVEDGHSRSMAEFASYADYLAAQSQPSSSKEPVNAAHLLARLRALRHALNNIPAQARRLACWQQKRDAALKAGQPTRMSPCRPGLPPSWRQRPVHEIDSVLRECHGLARDFMNST